MEQREIISLMQHGISLVCVFVVFSDIPFKSLLKLKNDFCTYNATMAEFVS